MKDVSHFDGISATEFVCWNCGLNTDNEHKGVPKSVQIKNRETNTTQSKLIQDLCVPCSRYSTMYNVVQKLQSLYMPSLFMILMIFFIDAFKDLNYLLPFLFIIVILPALISTSLISHYLYIGVRDVNRIVHLIRFSKKLGNSGFYEKALNIAQNEEVPDKYKIVILDYLVENILLTKKTNPMDFFEDWSSALGISESEMIEMLFQYTQIREGIRVETGVSVLPDIWPYIEDEKLKMEILDILDEECTKQFNNENLINYFMEDMYLIEEDIQELIEKHEKWSNVEEKLENFVPEDVPKNKLEEFKRQAIESSRNIELQKLEQQKMKTDQNKP